ncbi:ABC di/oligopeptide transporter inner membrane subunit [Sphaerisporangium krabiense]|uniref:Peptide/nickel transport system permease protein n=1 Tax=Sphaerisporangium krabiense TaxID=763782 RepID=A0A7W8Z516_9ACTN|nr:ABC transporter permease [Sphaerisporangium krabiense]MBB5627599.1 peptide/nickel transport system permease protein [Sphaerisporangium krabiense]GII66613.1 ABC di/oligopeptide transporter inner membrane subunit [Sphaerisporangium krabiense]
MLLVVLRRLRDLVVVLAVVGTFLFFLLRSIPGDPAQVLLGLKASPEQLARLHEELGLTGPLYEQYFHWVGNVLTGDFGTSIKYQAPVLDMIAGHIAPTLTLAIASTVISFLLTVLVISWVTVSPHSWVARGVNRVAQFGLALPEFWLALLAVYVFALALGWFPTSGYTPLFTDPVTSVPQLVLPIAVLVVGQTAFFTITMEESVLGELTQLYLRTARAKGVTERRIALRHVLPNSMLPVLTTVGLNFASLIGGVVVIESIFVIPGLGTMLLGAVYARDFPLIQGGVMFIAFLFVVVNLLVDLAYSLVDPKVRVS